MPPEVDETGLSSKHDYRPSEKSSLLTGPGDSQKHPSQMSTSSKESSSFGQTTRRERAIRAMKTVLVLAVVAFVVAVLFVVCTKNKQESWEEKEKEYLDCKKPLSRLHPVHELGLPDYHRPNTTLPSPVLHKYIDRHGGRRPIPTNSWYQNFLLIRQGEEPSHLNRAYTIPYIVDAAGPIPGLRMHTNHLEASTTVLQLGVNGNHGITLGVAPSGKFSEKTTSNLFSVHEMTKLAITLGWDDFGMSTPIVKGMAYATMSYNNINIITPDGHEYTPAIVTEIPVDTEILVDGDSTLSCSSSVDANSEPSETSAVWVQRELQLYTPESDFTWLVFVSQPVQMSCEIHGRSTILRVVNSGRLAQQVLPFYFRTALLTPCTAGRNPVYCHQEQMHPTALHVGQGAYEKLLREHAHLYPGPRASVAYDIDESEKFALVMFDWDEQAIGAPLYPAPKNETALKEIITFALPHHMDMMDHVKSPADDLYCAPSLVGPACLVEGSVWALREQMPKISFRAERPPASWSLQSLALSLSKDLDFRVPDNYFRGAGDTYFSGKMLAKLGRILVINEELQDICNSDENNDCQDITLPSQEKVTDAIGALRSSVEVWINGTGETPFVYDSAWGGMASCGCMFNDKLQSCDNSYPDCPAFGNPGLNFGNAFYNDMHFHYGYHIFGAAVVANFDPDWGKKYFEQVLLLIRNIANPSEDDEFFPIMRHKDVYQGHSWASGIAVSPLNGRNQESSSESVAAYESVALYGTVMASIFDESEELREQHARAVEVRRVGKLMTASELRSTKKYYHVRRDREVNIFPAIYTPQVIGIMWQTMAQFQTWFGGAPFLPIGIQLLPLTPIAEQRDNVDWAKSMYPSLEKSCSNDKICEEQGWSVLQLGALATVGHREVALSRLEMLPAKVFESAGGNGHSLSNTVWFIATRAPVEPLPVNETTTSRAKNKPGETASIDCGVPETCTAYVLDTVVDVYTCRQRIQWLIQHEGKSQKDACVQLAAVEQPRRCGQCNPMANYTETVEHAEEEAARLCPPCSEKQCYSDLNRCPLYERTYVCTEGSNVGGCSDLPWSLSSNICSECCDLTDCPVVSPFNVTTIGDRDENISNCPLCNSEDCESANGKLCPIHVAPFLCTSGMSKGGCAPYPWSLHDGQCTNCCEVSKSCLK